MTLSDKTSEIISHKKAYQIIRPRLWQIIYQARELTAAADIYFIRYAETRVTQTDKHPSTDFFYSCGQNNK